MFEGIAPHKLHNNQAPQLDEMVGRVLSCRPFYCDCWRKKQFNGEGVVIEITKHGEVGQEHPQARSKMIRTGATRPELSKWTTFHDEISGPLP